MTKSTALPIIDLSLEEHDGASLSKKLYDVFTTTGFAYLINPALSVTSEEVFSLAREFFLLPDEQKMKLAKRSFRAENPNTYRGYFPVQPEQSTTNLKEGFEIGPPTITSTSTTESSSSSRNQQEKKQHQQQQIILSEPTVWPQNPHFKPTQSSLETLYTELQALSAKLLSSLAISLNKSPDHFSDYLTNSLSTLRLLHYPLTHPSRSPSTKPHSTQQGREQGEEEELSCTPHTDSGLLTLLYQDTTGGLEVLDSDTNTWIPVAPVPGAIVVNIGDLMARVSGGRFVATMHRVKRPSSPSSFSLYVNGNVHGDGQEVNANAKTLGRLSVPFFFEPGEECLVKSVDGKDEEVIYGDHVRGKMQNWVEFM